MKRLQQITQQIIDGTLPSLRSAPLRRPVNCLIVEDDSNDAIMALEAVGSVGAVEAMVAKSGDEAIGLLNESVAGFRPKFDIVFVDLRLNGSEAQGQDVIRQIRERFPQTHTVIMSGYLSQGVVDALRGAYVGIVSKPLMPECLEEIISKHRMRHED